MITRGPARPRLPDGERASSYRLLKRHQAGQPVLIGTASVEKVELLSQMLRKAHPAVLNWHSTPARPGRRDGARARSQLYDRPWYRHRMRAAPVIAQKNGCRAWTQTENCE